MNWPTTGDSKQQNALPVNLPAASPNFSLPPHQVRAFLWQRPTSQTHCQGTGERRLRVPTTQRSIRDTPSSVAPTSSRLVSTQANWSRLWWSAQVGVFVCVRRYVFRSVSVRMICKMVETLLLKQWEYIDMWFYIFKFYSETQFTLWEIRRVSCTQLSWLKYKGLLQTNSEKTKV